MSRSSRAAKAALSTLAAGGLAVGLMTAAQPATAGVSIRASAAGASSGPVSHRVTLITGDVVTVTGVGGGKSTVSVEPAPGATGAVRTETVGKDLYVLPEAALPYLAADRLDSRLFDVTKLIADGYDDAHADALPVIVGYQDGVDSSKVATPTGATRTSVLSSIDGAALSTPKRSAASFWAAVTPADVVPAKPVFSAGIAKIYLDGKVEADLAESVAQVHAPQAWAAGYDGSGTTVAVLDTGIDAGHPDLAGQVDDAVSFVPGEDTKDYFGHGTHVASTIAGTGAASGGVEKGVAPGAHLVIGKVLGNDGFGQESWIINGMQWAANHAHVVNMSLGSNEPSNGMDDPMVLAVNSLSAQTGALFVIAAGNQGTPGYINSPGAADDALTVGAVDGSDQLAWFSNMGPRLGDSAIKPDIVAPGVDISAARSQYSEGEGDYVTMSGTSMATPHVTGAAAILEDRHPNWTGQQIKDALMSAADGVSDPSPYDVGDGRLNVERAVLGTVQATGSRFFGLLSWPNVDVDPITRSVTYTNSGKTKALLKLSLVMRDASGAAAPKGAFTLPTEVTVPAHGSRTIKITATPNKVNAGTRYAGAVVATRGGATVARTSLAMDKEAEKYNLTLKATGRDGSPAQTWIAIHASSDGFTDPYLVDGERTLRLPAGTYSAMTFMDVHDAADAQGIALVGSPEVDLDQDRVVELDATQAVPVTASVGKANAETTYRQMEYYVSGGGGYTEALIMPAVVDNMYAQPTTAVSDETFDFSARWRLRTPIMRVVAGKEVLDTIQQYGSPWLDGKNSQDAVYVGAGTEADYAGVDATGKVAVITFTPTTDLYTAAQTASAHGAVFLLVVNDADGELAWYASGPNGETAPVPVATVSGLQGAGLIQRLTHGDLTVTTSGDMDTPWTYDLVDAHEGSIPADLTYHPDASELARITTKYYGRKPHLGGEFRYDFRPQDPYGMGSPQYMNFPATRVEYVSTQPGTEWYQGVQTIDGNWDLRGDRRTYDAGQNLVEKWFTPVVYPRLGPGYWGPVRQYDSMQLNLPSYGDAGRNHTGSMGDSDGTSSQVIEVYQGDTLLKHSQGWQATYVGDLSPDKTLYRATSDISRSAAEWATSTHLHSEYTFWSEHDDGTSQALLPFVQVGFDVNTDMRDDAKAGAKDTIGFTAWQLPNVIDGGDIAGGKLSVSYDAGKTWTPLTLTGGPGNWQASVTYPDNPAQWVSLKATAWDDAGNRSSQTIIRAYGLR